LTIPPGLVGIKQKQAVANIENLNKGNLILGRLSALKTFGIPFTDNPFLRMLLILSFFVLSAAFIPFVGFIFLFFLPLIIFFYGIVAGPVKTAAAFVIPLLLILLFSQLLQFYTPYPVIVILGIVGMTMSAVASNDKSIEKTVVYPALIIIGAISTFFIYSGFLLSVHPWKLVQQFVEKIIELNINFYAQLPLDKEEISSMKNSKPVLVSFFTGIFPALIIIKSVFIVWINVLIGRENLRKKAITFPRLEGLSQWRAPEFLIWIFILSGGLLLYPIEQARFLSMNIFIFACFIYLLQGLAILSFLFQKKNVPTFFRYIFYFLIAVQQFLMIPVIIVGLFDIWVDFRKYINKNQPVNE